MDLAFNAIIRGIPAHILKHWYHTDRSVYDFLILFPFRSIPICEDNPQVWVDQFIHAQLTHQPNVNTVSPTLLKLCRHVGLNLIERDELQSYLVNTPISVESVYRATYAHAVNVLHHGTTMLPFSVHQFQIYGFRLLRGMAILRQHELSTAAGHWKNVHLIEFVQNEYTWTFPNPWVDCVWMPYIMAYLETRDVGLIHTVVSKWSRLSYPRINITPANLTDVVECLDRIGTTYTRSLRLTHLNNRNEYKYIIPTCEFRNLHQLHLNNICLTVKVQEWITLILNQNIYLRGAELIFARGYRKDAVQFMASVQWDSLTHLVELTHNTDAAITNSTNPNLRCLCGCNFPVVDLDNITTLETSNVGALAQIVQLPRLKELTLFRDHSDDVDLTALWNAMNSTTKLTRLRLINVVSDRYECGGLSVVEITVNNADAITVVGGLSLTELRLSLSSEVTLVGDFSNLTILYVDVRRVYCFSVDRFPSLQVIHMNRRTFYQLRSRLESTSILQEYIDGAD